MRSNGGSQHGSPPKQNKANRLVSFDSGLKGELETRHGPSEEIDVQSALTYDEILPSSIRTSSSINTTSCDGNETHSMTSLSMATVTETPSVARIITTLLSIPSNRKCADCRVHMIDSSQTFASFSPSLGKPPANSVMRRSIDDFKFHHQAFAPASQKPKSEPAHSTAMDPSLSVVELLGGHAVFICKACSEAHLHLGPTIATVKSANDFSTWSLHQAKFIQCCGGNATNWSVYEGFIPDGWKGRVPNSSSSIKDRIIFSHAKYDALAFVLPSSDSIIARQAWKAMLEKDLSLKRYAKQGCMLMFLSKISLVEGSCVKRPADSMNHDSAMPDRFVDFFCVVGPKKLLLAGEKRKDLYAIDSPEGLALESTVLDCYPAPDSYGDMQFPGQISQFVFPDGCRVSETQKPPSLFTFVLTAGNGYRLYGAALRVYDETMETSQMKDVLHASGYTVPLPWWLSDSSVPPLTKERTPKCPPSDIVFLPKCLVVISHYPFFNAFRVFLKQLYQLSILEAPLPIERYITNFTTELPLPPQGKVEVKFGFMSDAMCTISRPAPNELPMASFSFKPLFTALSISNILVVMGCLLEETKVVLLSKRYGLLTPCAEALLSFLFPFEWQGIYIPVMPSSLLDILDAPVPFLVGLHARYLAEVKPEHRPNGVVFVDLDRDTVHLGFCESDHDSFQREKRLPPHLPEKDSMKLRNKLQECVGCLYVLPNNGIKGLITHGYGDYVHNSMRELYAHMEECDPSLRSADTRARILDEAEHAFPASGGSSVVAGFVSEEGQLSTKSSIDTFDKSDSKPKFFSKIRAKIDRRQGFDSNDNSSRTQVAMASPGLYETEETIGSFKVSDIRNSFLRFFTSIFNGYDKYAAGSVISGELIRAEDFLNEKNLSPSKRLWLCRVLKTQMLQRFLEERLEDPHDPSVLFFDEAIIAKNNRSMKKTIKQGKVTTPFLDDESWKICDSFTPPAPSNWGLPADGRRYSYPKFPRLQKSSFGTPRPKKRWPSEWQQKIQRKEGCRVKSLRRHAMLQNAIGTQRMEILMTAFGGTTGVPTLLTKLSDMPTERNLDWALSTVCQSIVQAMNSLASQSSPEHRKGFSSESAFSSHQPVAPDHISTARDIILAARRKQGILMLRVVKIQSQTRKHIHIRKYKRYATALHSQNEKSTIADLPFVLKNVVVLQSVARLIIVKKHYRRQLASILRIQRNFRRLRELSMLRKVKSVVAIQVWLRGIIARRLAKNRLRSIILVQSAYRGVIARFRFALVKSELIKIQSQTRSFLVRKHAHGLLSDQVIRYRCQVFCLWARASTPLSYRTQMWSLFKSSFLGSRILTDELHRMWKFLGIKTSASKIATNDKVLTALEKMGCCTTFELKFLSASSVIAAAEKNCASFPGEISDLGKRYAKRLEIERLQVYERLNGLSKTSKLHEIYELFGISALEKKKKARALERIWLSVEFASQSAKAMTLLFPELADNVDIRQVKPSKKGLTRFHAKPKDTLLDPLDKDLWVDRKLDNYFRKNMSEVAIATLKTMPDLSIKLHVATMHWNTSFRRRKQARVMGNGGTWNDWCDYKREAMYKYLHCC